MVVAHIPRPTAHKPSFITRLGRPDMAQAKVTFARLLQIKERQWEDRWSPHYVAGTFADPFEAPGISTGTILRPVKLGCREFHTLSRSETWCSFLALYHPHCWEIFDQRIMSPTARPHLLFGHPRASGLSLLPFAGTVDVADRLGMLSKHPKVRLQIGPDPMHWPLAPFPYFCDLTLCMEDAQGPYVLDWPVKDKFEDFRRRGPGKSRARPDEDDPSVVQRTLLQETYFCDAGIRSQQVVGRAIDFQVRCNLRDLFMDDSFPVTVNEGARAEIMQYFRDCIGQDTPAYLMALRVSRNYRISDREATALIKQGIWRRELRVDLFQPVLMDQPLRPETKDILVQYGNWFAR